MQLTDLEVTLIAQFVFPAVVAGVIAAYRWIVSKLPANQQATVERVVNQVVAATEQAQSLVPSQVKKQYATNMVNLLLKRLGVKASPEQVDTLIESAVYALNQNQMHAVTAIQPAVK